MTYDEQDAPARVKELLAEAGLAGLVERFQLERLDQFHVGGAAAVDELLEILPVARGDRVLDIGSGLGGPARQIAAITGAYVHGVDITDAYVEVARELTKRCELDNLVTFEAAGVDTMAAGPLFDSAVSLHVQMNVEDKVRWFSQILGRLRPQGYLALWEVCETGTGQDVAWPMPWSLDGSDSHLVAPEALHAMIQGAGFETIDWADRTTWANEWFAATFASGPPPGPSLAAFLDDGFARLINLAAALADGTLSLHRGLFRRFDEPPGG